MKLSTAAKIRIAGALCGIVAPLRWCLRQPADRAICQRDPGARIDQRCRAARRAPGGGRVTD
jgi:hypothetical protein